MARMRAKASSGLVRGEERERPAAKAGGLCGSGFRGINAPAPSVIWRVPGDGKSAKTAWVVINTHEEYSMLRAFGLRPAGQALIHQDGHSYDQMKATEQDGTEQTFYFNVDIPMKVYR